MPPRTAQLPREFRDQPSFEPDLLGGVATLSGTAVATRPEDDQLYRTAPWPAERVPQGRAIP